ncbi:hypothetical protein FACS1894163_10720 [Spirochaetia bacterium]|nr:hypothetical protein FACS1894163_10720 [Spirochaetia bacterium]
MNTISQGKERAAVPLKYRLFLMLLPFIILTALFAYLPLYGWRYAFFNYRPGIPLKWADFVGFRWFASIVASEARRAEVLRVMKNTLAISGLGIATSWFPIAFAILLSEMRNIRYKKLIQTLTTIPNFISWVLVYSFAFTLFSVDAGLVNRVLMNLGLIDKGINFLLSGEHMWLKMTAWGIWKGLGWGAIMYLAALAGIDQEDHERARLGEIAALEALCETPPAAAVTAANRYPDILAAGERLRKIQAAEQRAAEQWAVELRAAYDRYVQRWPDNYSIRRDRALYLVHTFEYEEAVKELETLLSWEPSNPSLRRVLAYGYRKTARYREAAVFLKSLLKEKPRDINLLLEYSGCLERAGAGVYAAAVLEKAMPLFTASAEIPLSLGILRYREKNLERAFDCLREAAARAPRDPRPWQWMATIARNKGEKESCHRYEYEAKKRKN